VEVEDKSDSVLDLTTSPVENFDNKPFFQEKDYDPRPQEDSARRRITYILLGLLGVVLIWALGSITFCQNSEEEVMNILQIVLSPLIALVSAATGFYFGSKPN